MEEEVEEPARPRPARKEDAAEQRALAPAAKEDAAVAARKEEAEEPAFPFSWQQRPCPVRRKEKSYDETYLGFQCEFHGVSNVLEMLHTLFTP